jgi:uncharacterized membrane protein YeiB
MTAPVATTTVASPIPLSQRALAPDLARGTMLCFIALANAANAAFAGQPGVTETPLGWERLVNFAMLLLVDARAYPVFAVMFGYGIAQIFRRQQSAGTDARSILIRRNLWLVVFGAAHAALLYFGDFLAAYGIVGLVCTVVLVQRGPRFHRIVLWLWAVQTVYAGWLLARFASSAHAGEGYLANRPNPSLAATTYGDSVIDRLHEWPVHTASVLPFIVIVWLGIWAAQHQILEHPGRHRRLLGIVAVASLGLAVVGGLPYALIGAGWWHPDHATLGQAAMLHAVTGEYGGPGYIALIALLAVRFASAQPALLRPMLALGRRSLSGYLFQSVVWLILFAPFALDLGGSTAIALAAGVGAWVLAAAGAQALESAGRRGPAEAALRRLTYRTGSSVITKSGRVRPRRQRSRSRRGVLDR